MDKQLELLRKETEINNKANSLEFQRIAGAFQKLGNLVDLLYLEVAVLLDILSAKKILTEKEFAEQQKQSRIEAWTTCISKQYGQQAKSWMSRPANFSNPHFDAMCSTRMVRRR